MFDDFVFGKDVFLKTAYPLALDSKDNWSPEDQKDQYGGFPLSIIADFWDGMEMAEGLFKMFPDKRSLLDLGTASGSVPLSMRRSGMNALGLEGQDCKNLDIPERYLKDPSLYAWKLAPEIVETCDITYPFKIVDSNGDVIKFDYIISTDCFEHLRAERLPALFENIYSHLKDDGYGIFDINTGTFHNMHQIVQNRNWWKTVLSERFVIREDLAAMNFIYIRAEIKDGIYRYRGSGLLDDWKIIIWVQK